jgi:putative zinc finger/helix-turn-helix YgiT family protein
MTLCVECGTEMLPPERRDQVPYPCGLPHVVLNGVLVRRCPTCGDEQVEVPRPLDLHRILALAVAHRPGALAPEEIRFLRKHLGWSGVDFARRFRTTPQTVSRWERGEMSMNPQAELLLRLLAPTLPPIDDYTTAEALPDDGQTLRLERVLDLLYKGVDEDVEDPETPIALELRGDQWTSVQERASC